MVFKRSTVLLICMCTFSYLVLETLSFGLYSYVYGKGFSFTELEQQRLEAQGQLQVKVKSPPHDSAPHPFVGYVWNYPTMKSANGLVTPYGYRAEIDPFVASKLPDHAIVGIAGGSVSEFFLMSENARNILRSYLKKLPAFTGKTIDLIALGRNSYQQPQQLFSTAYYLLQGLRLDLLINLDGHNEACYGFENQARNTHPTFPLYWPQYTGDFSPRQLSQLVEAAMWRHVRSRVADVSTYLSASVTASTLWSLSDDYILRRALQAEMASQDVTQQGKKPPYYITGPDTLQKLSRPEMASYELQFWKRASLQLYGLSRTNGFIYFHFLQPNQYVAGSKPLSEEERNKFYDETIFTNRNIKEFYPLFIAGVAELRTQGIHAYSLTDIFKNTPQSVYMDSCCHLNDEGNQIMAHKIGQQIQDTLTAQR